MANVTIDAFVGKVYRYAGQGYPMRVQIQAGQTPFLAGLVTKKGTWGVVAMDPDSSFSIADSPIDPLQAKADALQEQRKAEIIKRIVESEDGILAPHLDESGSFAIAPGNPISFAGMGFWTDMEVPGEVRKTQNGNDFQFYGSMKGVAYGAVCLRFHLVNSSDGKGQLGPWFDWMSTDGGVTLHMVGQSSENTTLDFTATAM